MAHTLAVGPVATAGSGGSRTITLNGVTALHGIVVALCFDSGSTITVTCSGESNLSAVNGTPFNANTFGGTDRLMIYRLDKVTTGGNKTITISGISSYCAGAGMSVAGGNTGGWFDVAGGSTGSSTTPSTSLTTTADGDLIVAICASNNSDAAVGAGYTVLTIANPNNFAQGEYDLDVGTAGSKTVSMDVSAGGSQPWGIYAASFKMASAASLNLTPSAAIGITGTVSVSGDIEAAEPVIHDIEQSGAVAIAGTLGVSGDLEYQVDWSFEPPLELPQISGTLGVSGDIEIGTEESLDLAPDALALTGAVGVSGDIEIGTSFDLAADPVALSGAVGVSGDILTTVEFDLEAGEVAMSGEMAVEGDPAWSDAPIDVDNPGGWPMPAPKRKKKRDEDEEEEPAEVVVIAPEPKRIRGRITLDHLTGRVTAKADARAEVERIAARARKRRHEEEVLLLF